MKHLLLVVALVLFGVSVSARLVNIDGLASAYWPQKGNQPIALPVYDMTTSPEWSSVVAEVVDAWDGAPFALSLVKVTDPSSLPASAWDHAITIADVEHVEYGGATWQFVDNRGKMLRASIGVEFASHYIPDAYAESLGFTWHYNLTRVLGHELGNALTMGEAGLHDDPRTDPGCIMGHQYGNVMHSAFDRALLCQRYGCGR